LTEPEIHAYDTLKQQVEALGFAENYLDARCLLRFLRARKFNVKKSLVMIQDDNLFREQFRGRNFQLSDFASLIVFSDDGIWRHGGCDKVGRPVVYAKPALFFPSQITDDEELVLFFVYYMDSLLKIADAEGREDFAIICDLKGWSFKNFSLPLTRLLINILQNYYPERLGRVFVLNMPMLFRGAWNIIYPLLDERTRCKICIKNANKLMLETISAEMLEKKYGGNHEEWAFRDPVVAPLFDVEVMPTDVNNQSVPTDDIEESESDSVSIEPDQLASPKMKRFVPFSRLINILKGGKTIDNKSKLANKRTFSRGVQNIFSSQSSISSEALERLTLQLDDLEVTVESLKKEQETINQTLRELKLVNSASKQRNTQCENDANAGWTQYSLHYLLAIMFAMQCLQLQAQLYG